MRRPGRWGRVALASTVGLLLLASSVLGSTSGAPNRSGEERLTSTGRAAAPPSAPTSASPRPSKLLPAAQNSLVATLNVGTYPAGEAVNPATDEVYIVNLLSANITLFNGTTLAAQGSFAVGGTLSYPTGAAYDPANGDLYVGLASLLGSGSVEVIKGSTNKAVTSIGAGKDPLDIAYDASNGDLYVSDFNSSEVTVIDGATNRAVTTIAVGSQPSGLVADPWNGNVYVANAGSANVSIINDTSNKVTGSIAVGTGPADVALIGPGRDLYVSDEGANNISVVNPSTNQTVGLIPVSSPEAMAYVASDGELYVSNYLADTLTALSLGTSTVVATLPTGSGPLELAYDNASGLLFVANSGGTTVTVVSTLSAYEVAFTETGLPSGTAWTVQLGLEQQSGIGSSIAFYVPNGTYNYSVQNLPGWRASSYNGSVLVRGEGTAFTIAWSRVTYSVTFEESGLALDNLSTGWSVSFGGTLLSGRSENLSFEVGNGSWSFAVGALAGYAVAPRDGSITVAGGAVARAIAFAWIGLSLTFVESGLPNGTLWTVTVGLVGGPLWGTLSSRGAQIVFAGLPENYTARYSLEPIPGYATDWAGQLPALEANESVNIPWAPVLYSVTFTESGLVGLPWGVTLAGNTSVNATGSLVSFSAANGTYDYNVSNVPGFRADAYRGTVTVAGAPAGITIDWVATAYTANWTETGLPVGAIWYLNVSGGSHVMETISEAGPASLELSLVNGSYPYTTQTNWRNWSAAVHGTVSLDGKDGRAAVTYRAVLYALTFAEGGLPQGSSWSVNVSGRTTSSEGASIELSAANGTYSYRVATVLSAYVPTPAYGNVTVAGGSASVTIAFTTPPPAPGQAQIFGLSLIDFTAAVALAAVLIGAVAFVLARRRASR